jgi:hypothetical protein
MTDQPSIWHHRRDTLLRISEGGVVPGTSDPYYSVHIPMGIYPGTLGRHNITVEYRLDRPYHFESDGQFASRRTDDDNGRYMRVGLNPDNPLGSIKRITPDFIAHLRYDADDGVRDPARVRPYLEMERVFRARPSKHPHDADPPAYYEAALHYVPRGACLRYRIMVYSHNRKPLTLPTSPKPEESDWYCLYVDVPKFGLEDIQYAPPQDDESKVNIIYWKNDRKYDLTHFRIDFLDTDRLIADFDLRLLYDDGTSRDGTLSHVWLGGDRGTAFDPPVPSISASWNLPSLPVVNPQYDYVALALRSSDLKGLREVHWRGARIGTQQDGTIVPVSATKVAPIRLMFIHYANQSLNDLFESPNKNYTPPQTFIQTMMRDPSGTYSSRPNANETGVGDGFHYAIEAHVKNRLPCVWSFNGGFLSMLAQDSPDDITSMKKRICDGLLEPAIGGFGGHRMLYFQEHTNLEAIQSGIDLMEHVLVGTGTVFCPNSRVYAATPNIDRPMADATIRRPVRLAGKADTRGFEASHHETRIGFVTIDKPAFDAYQTSIQREPHQAQRNLWGGYQHAYLWRQRCPQHRQDDSSACTPECRTWYWLFIDGKLKDELLTASDAEWQRGKLATTLRRHFFYGVTHPDIAADCLFVYQDDADKAAGTGWFDGDYNGVETNFAAIFAAALEWIAAHPWLQVVTGADLDPASESIGTIYVKDAIDPYIHQDIARGETPWGAPPQTEQSFDAWSKEQTARTNGFEYGCWYQEWRTWRSSWLQRDLGHLVEPLEEKLFGSARPRPGNDLDRVARLGFLIGVHEPHWSKEPLEPFISQRDFQQGRWDNPLKAYQRRIPSEPEDFVLCASLQLRNAHVFHCAARWAELAQGKRMPPGGTWKNNGPLEPYVDNWNWDLDITENVVLYNDRLLVVMDQNGGRITHVFALDKQRPVVVSGNIKAYQFLGDDRQYDGKLPSDGAVFQNTVFAPNHQYIGSDVRQSRAKPGQKFNPKTKVRTVVVDGRELRVEAGVFGDEDWLYPDNFNSYTRLRGVENGDDHVVWSYPGLAQRDAKPMTSERFDAALAAYGELVRGQDREPQTGVGDFQKAFRLAGNQIEVTYSGAVPAAHLVANEFSLDLLGMLMRGERQIRRWSDVTRGNSGSGVRAITLTQGDLSVRVRVRDNCRFSFDTLEGETNLRLHRAFSDCLEVQSLESGAFTYAIDVPSVAGTDDAPAGG